MRILYMVTAPIEANSSANICNIALIKGFLKLGHEVSLVSTECNPLSSAIYERHEILNEIKIYRLEYGNIYSSVTTSGTDGDKTTLKDKIKGILRFFFHRLFIFDHYRGIVSKINQIDLEEDYYDVVITASDPKSAHLLGRRFTRRFKGRYGRWIQYWGDPIYIDITSRLVLPGFIIRRVEVGLLKQADAVVYVSPLTCEEQKRIYPRYAKRIFFYPPPYIKPRVYGKKPSAAGSIILGCYGAYISSVRNMMPLYEAVKTMEGVRLDIAGNSDMELEPARNVTIWPRISYSEVESREAEADILVCICNRRGTQIPAKLYHYAATDKPILVIVDGEAEKMIEYLSAFNRFVLCRNEAGDIRRAVASITAGDTNVREAPLSDCAPDNIARGILSLAGRL